MLLLAAPPPPFPSPTFLRLPHRSLLSSPNAITISPLHQGKRRRRSRRRGGVCKAELAQDAPFAVAIGACILNSVVFPVYNDEEEDVDGGTIGSTDARLAVMGVISFIPYFDWMSWVFAWLDSGRRRYLLYSLVYLAPYLRTNFSVSPEESWLPIASVLLCIFHVQLEISVMNGDLDNISLLNDIRKLFSVTAQRQHSVDDNVMHNKEREKDPTKLPSAHQSRNKISEWKVTKKSADRHQQLNRREESDEERTESD